MQGNIEKVITFATTANAGNPAYVVRVAQEWIGSDYSTVCRDLNIDMLAVLEADNAKEPCVDYFTRSGRHSGAGHATHAAAFLQLSDDGAAHFRKHDGQRQLISRRGSMISVSWPVMTFEPIDLVKEIERATGLIARSVFNSAFGYVAILDDENALKQFVPDDNKIAALACNALVLSSPGSSSDIALRVFAPKLGLPEDPVCGTAHRIIVPYWFGRLGRRQVHSRQFSPRGGDVYCDFQADTVIISGEAALNGSIESVGL